MTKTFMRVNKKLLEQLKARKQVARESYSDVVERMIRNETSADSVQKILRAKHGKKQSSVGMRFATEKELNDYMQGR